MSLRPALFLALVAPAAASLCGQGPYFADDRPRLPPLPPAVACAWHDLNGDRLLDLVQAGGGELVVLLQDRGGRFVARQAAVPLPPLAVVAALAAGQFTPDAFPDVAVVLQGGAALLAANDGQGGLRLAQPSPFGRPPASPATGALAGDVDGRGLDDLLVLTDGGRPQLWVSSPAGAFTDVSATALPPVALPAARGVLADLDRDGDRDVVLASALGAVPVVLANDGSGVFGVEPNAIAVGPVAVQDVAVAPLDGDLLPDLLFAVLGAAPQAAAVLRNGGQRRFAPLPQTGTDLQLGATVAVCAGPLDGDAFADAAFLLANGELRLGRNVGNGVLRAAGQPLPAGSRHLLAGGDVDGDGDADLLTAGRAARPEVLLGDGRLAFLATEAATLGALPVDRATSWAPADANGDGDLDLVACDAQGLGRVFGNDGSGSFAPRGAAPQLPAGVYGQLLPAAIARPGAADVVAVGQPNAANPQGLRLLVGGAAGLRDETAQRLPAALGWLPVHAAAGDVLADGPGTNGFADVVLADARGAVLLLVNRSGVLTAQAAPFATVAAVSGVLLAHANGDALLDVVVLSGTGPPHVFVQVAPGGQFTEVVGAVPMLAGAAFAAAGDLTGDGVTDLALHALFAAPRLQLFAGLGDGRFLDQSAQLPALPAASALAIVPKDAGGRGPALVVGATVGGDSVLLARAGAAFAAPVVLPVRTASGVQRAQVGDLDGDGDGDLLLEHENGGPSLLFGDRVQFAHLGGATQVGRLLELRVRAPRPNAGVLAALFFGVAPARVPIAPFGVLRLAAPTHLVAFAVPATPGHADLAFPIGPAFPTGALPMQAFVFDTTTATGALSSLELVEFTSH